MEEQLKQVATSHIYTAKSYARSGVFTLCKGFVDADERSIGRCSATAWFIGDTRQWSFGAGSRAECPHCLAEWLKRSSVGAHVAITKLHATIVEQEDTIQALAEEVSNGRTT